METDWSAWGAPPPGQEQYLYPGQASATHVQVNHLPGNLPYSPSSPTNEAVLLYSLRPARSGQQNSSFIKMKCGIAISFTKENQDLYTFPQTQFQKKGMVVVFFFSCRTLPAIHPSHHLYTIVASPFPLHLPANSHSPFSYIANPFSQARRTPPPTFLQPLPSIVWHACSCSHLRTPTAEAS